ncbi:neocarzinostatin apoprotein domain-containing protein [Nocardia sp. NPDC005366]|uniref:neocarzinostatin apoprotein domain-containing protein n=1 Tax=Nocardia sp. NPDC005366 TaxID=3156878 RepID=UPI0033ADEA72
MKLVNIRFGVVAAATCAAALGATAIATASPYLSVSQSSGLSAGQSVYVSLSGYDGDISSVAIGQCKARVAGPSDCNLGGTFIGSSEGSITLAGAIGGVDCTAAAGACIIGVTSLNNPGAILATVPLSFG